MKKSVILILLFALSSNIYSQEIEIDGFQEGMNKMENLARRSVKKIIKKRRKSKSETFHILIVPSIYPANRYIEDREAMIAYTDSLLSRGRLIGKFPIKELVEYYLYDGKKEFICSGEIALKGYHYYNKNLFDAIIALNPKFVFMPDFVAGYYYVFTHDKIYKLKNQFEEPPIVTLLYSSKK